MKYRKRNILKDEDASVWPVIIVFIVLGITSFLILLFGVVLEPFFDLGAATDDTIDPQVSAPRGYGVSFLRIVWPNGLLLVILIGTLSAMIMYYQKKRYQEIQ